MPIENKELSEKEVLEAISLEFYLNKKRIENEKYEATYNFGKCKICSDDATGIHYGTTTCEGCKGFFKRSVPIHKKYVCRGTQSCKIYPKMRKKCKYCRWMACLNSGMSLNSVRMGRIPNSMKQIKQKSQIRTIHHVPIENVKENFCLSLKYLVKLNRLDRFKSMETQCIIPDTYLSEKYIRTSNENQLIVLSLLRDKSFQLFKESLIKIENYKQRALTLIETGYTPVKYEYTKEFIDDVRSKDLEFLKNHIISFLELIRELPGFQRLKNNDIRSIVNTHFFIVLSFRAYRLYIDDEYFLMLDDEFQLTKEAFGMIAGSQVRDKVLEHYSNLNRLKLTDQEIGLSIPYIISSLDNEIESKSVLSEINEYYCRALYNEFNLNKRTPEFMETFAKVVCSAPKINTMCLDVNLGIKLFSA